MDIEDYILTHSDAEHPYLHRLYRATQTHLLYGRMASGHLQGQLLRMLVGMIRPRTVVEIGTYSGYSALCMASALDTGAHLHTIEVLDELEDFTRPWIEQSPWADRVTFHIADALQLIPTMGLTFDLAFIDGNKRNYTQYYQTLMPHMAPGAYIIADNTLWDGHVLEPAEGLTQTHTDQQTRGIMQFNDTVAADTRVEKVILPLRDGLTIIKIIA